MKFVQFISVRQFISKTTPLKHHAICPASVILSRLLVCWKSLSVSRRFVDVKMVDLLCSVQVLFITFVVIYAIVYLRMAVKMPRLIAANSKFGAFILDNSPVVQERFCPSVWCFHSNL